MPGQRAIVNVTAGRCSAKTKTRKSSLLGPQAVVTVVRRVATMILAICQVSIVQ